MMLQGKEDLHSTGVSIRKKVLVITVGKGRGVENAISRSIRDQNPDIIYFVASEDSEKEVLQAKVIPTIPKEKEYHIEKYSNDDVQDIRKMIEVSSRLIQKLVNDYGRENIYVDFTPGTKPMSAGVVIGAIENRVESLSYVGGSERDEAGRVLPGCEKLISISLKLTYQKEEFNNAVQLFNNRDFSVALDIMAKLKDEKNIRSDKEFSKKADCLYALSMAYSLWEKFDIANAFTALVNVSKDHSELLAKWGIKNRIEDNKEILYKVKNNPFCYEKIVDLFLNAKRRFEEKRFDDATARMYRLVEYIFQYKINEKIPYKPLSDGTLTIVYEKLPEDLRNKYKNKISNGKLLVGLEDDYDILKNIDVEFAQKIDFHGAIKKLLTKRNYSILAHGFSPIEENVAEKLKDTCNDIIKLVVPEDELVKINSKISFPKIKV